MDLIWTRDSVCMADDCAAPNTWTETVPAPLTAPLLLERALGYVPHVTGSVWAVRVGEDVAGYLRLDRQPPQIEAAMDGGALAAAVSRHPRDAVPIRCVLYHRAMFCRRPKDGPPVEKFPGCPDLLDKVKLEEASRHGT